MLLCRIFQHFKFSHIHTDRHFKTTLRIVFVLVLISSVAFGWVSLLHLYFGCTLREYTYYENHTEETKESDKPSAEGRMNQKLWIILGYSSSNGRYC